MSDKLNQQIKIDMDDDTEPIDQNAPLIKISAIDDSTIIDEESEALLDDNTHDDGGITDVDDGEYDNNSICAKFCYIPRLFCLQIDRIDKKLSSYIFKFSGGKILDVFIAIGCLAFSYFGFPLWIVIYIIIMQSYLYALCVLVSIVVTQIMKRCIKRSRPKISDLGQRWFYLSFEDVSTEHSFPSGDTSQSAVFAVTLGYSLDSDYFYLLFCVTPFVALGRIYFGRHYIGDTVAGALTGVAVGYGVNYFLVHHMYRITNYV
eukprot:197799_1